MIPRSTRRGILASLACVLVPSNAMAANPTPRQAEGPFYPRSSDRVVDEDWDLVKIDGSVRHAGGEILHLSGQVRTRSGDPAPGIVVEIWQCDVNGRYRHAGDRGVGRPLDEAFQGFGRTRTDDRGRYRFRTIRPVSYPGRTPHIHAKVFRDDGSVLTTQIYVDGEPANRHDFLFRSLGRRAQAALSMPVDRRRDGELKSTFNFVI
ncbi:MAG: protocatechuate 3,4-dioxygenase [Pseudomonadota bacterium]